MTSSATMTIPTDKSLKKAKIIFWIFTTIFVLFDGVMPLFFFNSKPAIEGIKHVGFPDYFRVELSIGKIIGGVLLIVPMVPARFKEWAYVGFGISLISAFIAHMVVDTPKEALMPVVVFAVLLTSYIYYHKIQRYKS